MTTHDETSTMQTLRLLDVAPHQLDEGQRTRAAATLEQILATDPHAPAPSAAHLGTPRPPRRRLVIAGGVAAAAVVAVLAVPLVTGGGEAFASWSRIPVELTGAERAAALDACLVLQGEDEGELSFDPTTDASVLVAEARGGWSYVVFTVAGRRQPRLQGSCLMPDAVVADPRPGQGGFFGSLGGAEEAAGPAVGRTVVRQDEYALGVIDDDMFARAEGRTGRDVVGLEVTTPRGRKVEASVEDGHWAAWWPAGDSSPRNPDASEAPTFRVTLRDGTVTHDVRLPR